MLSRWSQHKALLKKGIHHSAKLQRAWNKYGADSFEFKVIEEVIDETMNLFAVEQKYIEHYNSYECGYNILPCAGLTRKDAQYNKDARLNIRMSINRMTKLRDYARSKGKTVTEVIEEWIDSLVVNNQ